MYKPFVSCASVSKQVLVQTFHIEKDIDGNAPVGKIYFHMNGFYEDSY